MDRQAQMDFRELLRLLRKKYRPSYVYFLQAEWGGPVKISLSVDVERRLAEMQAATSEKLVLREAKGHKERLGTASQAIRASVPRVEVVRTRPTHARSCDQRRQDVERRGSPEQRGSDLEADAGGT